MNVQGLGDKNKRRDVIHFLKNKKYSIVMLQDTHFTGDDENYIRMHWGYKCYFSNYNSQSRGVATLINNTFDFKLENEEKDMGGNLLILNCKIDEKDVTLINIYGPNKDSPRFYDSLSEKMSKYTNSSFILAGDFNIVLNPDMDAYNYIHLNNPNARERVINIMADYNLIDCWRENNLDINEYTWFRRNPIKKARLDLFLVSEYLYMDITTTKILPGYRTDHSLIYLSLELGTFKQGRSYWKFNNSLLKDITFVENVKKIVTDTKSLYVIDIPDVTQ